MRETGQREDTGAHITDIRSRMREHADPPVLEAERGISKTYETK